MPAWFTTARNSLSGATAAPRQAPFERVCLCGETLVGERDDSPQTLVCERCGRDWFVLPGDVYPFPRSRKTKKKKSPRREESRATNGRGAVIHKSASGIAGEGSEKTAGDGARETAVAETTPAIPAGPAWHERLRRRARRGARPIRLVVAGVLVLFVLTGFWIWYQARLDQAAAVLVDAVPAAEAAIDKGDLPTAAARMGEAAAALDFLGRDDAAARRIRQRHRELVAITELASLTPSDLAAEAELSASAPARWTSRFASSYAGQWVILDVPLGKPRAATTNQPPKMENPVDGDGDGAAKEADGAAESGTGPLAEIVIPLELPLLAGDTPVVLELEAEALEKLEGSSRAILAARYRSWRLVKDATGKPEWVVRFDPRTVFLWTSPDLYEAAGFVVDDPYLPAGRQLAKQAKLLGIAVEEDVPAINNPPNVEIEP